jgi:hypothetical protein
MPSGACGHDDEVAAHTRPPFIALTRPQRCALHTLFWRNKVLIRGLRA